MSNDPEASIDQYIDDLKHHAGRPVAGPAGGPILEVLQAFCDKLNQLEYVRCAIEPGPVPWIVNFVTYPRFRPELRSIMLSFHYSGADRSRVVAVRGEPMDVDALWAYLAEFLRYSEFPNTLAHYESMASQDVAAGLKLEWSVGDFPDDVPVIVSAKDQEVLVRKGENRDEEPIDISVRLDRRFNLGTYDASEKYRFLDSAGAVLRIARHAPEGDPDVVSLHGTVVPLDEVDDLT